MKRYIIAILLFLLLLPFFANSQISSEIKEDSLKSDLLGVTRKYTVYLPESYSQNGQKSYPVLYLLHGHSHRNNDWAKDGRLKETADGLMEKGSASEMIIITPDAGSVHNGYFDMPGWSYERFFFEEFIPYVETKYRILREKNARAIAGFSMGGGGAVAYAVKHPDLFSAVYAMSALMSLPEQERPNTMEPEYAEFGRSILTNDCIALIKHTDKTTLEKLHSIQWFVDCGDDDFLLDVNTLFHREMKRAGVPCELRIRDGNHDWEYWRSSLCMALPFISEAFKKNPPTDK